MKHETIFNYTSIWMDTLRGGKFQLANTNKLIRFYDGANGLKTGSTSKALCCLSAAAKRNDMQLIAVVLGAPTSAERFASAKSLLDYGFANYAVNTQITAGDEVQKIAVEKCVVNKKVLENCGIDSEEYSGFAFGIGLERTAMLKYGINNIKMLFGSDLRVLKQINEK